jgi:hypothetical protein
MDPNTQIILATAARAENREDRERADNSLEALLEEFDKRLPAGKPEQDAGQRNGEPEKRQ